MDKASTVLESLTASSPQLPIGYQRLSANCLPVDKEIDLDSSLVQAPLPEPGCAKPILDQPLVGKSVNSGSPPVDHSISEEHHSHVLLISLDSPESENESPVPANPESPSSVPLEQGVNHMIPPPSSTVVSFYWSHLTTFHPKFLSRLQYMPMIRQYLALFWMKFPLLVLCLPLLGKLWAPHNLCRSRRI